MDSTTGNPVRHHVSALVARIRRRLAEESQAGLWTMGDDELTGLLDDLRGLSAQLESLVLAAVAEVDRRDVGRAAGATSTAQWLSGRLRMRPEHATRTVALARDLDTSLAATDQALRAGEITADHAGVIARTVRDLPSEAGPEGRVEVEQALVSQARSFDPKALAKLGTTILNTVDPELADRVLAQHLAAQEAREARQRDLSLHDDPDGGGTWIRGRLDTITAAMFRVALEPLAKPLPSTADGPDLRTPSQRLGDGLAELVRRYLDSGVSPSQGGEKPHLVITISHESLRSGVGAGSLLRTGAPVSARTAQQLGCDATISWYVPSESGRSGPRLSERVRLFTARTRRLLELRDLGCAFPGCDRPPGWCHAHHIVPWSRGGPTTVANGVLLCGHHHRLVHQGSWRVRMAADQLPEFVPPNWVDARRTPIRGHRLRS